MPAEPVIVREDDLAWDTWPEAEREQRGDAAWKTLIDGAETRSDTLTMGVARLPPGAELREHHHAQPEVYYMLSGSAVVTIDGQTRTVAAGAAVFIPGNVRHACRNDGDTEARFAYLFAADSFDDIEYVF
jgi:quercetin dioxygenase-like cupin family protein